MNRVFLSLTGAVFGSLSLMGCQPDSAEQNTIASSSKMSPAMILPMTDPENSGGWVLNEALSDEFNQPDIDHDKWLVQGGEVWLHHAFHRFKSLCRITGVCQQ